MTKYFRTSICVLFLTSAVLLSACSSCQKAQQPQSAAGQQQAPSALPAEPEFVQKVIDPKDMPSPMQSVKNLDARLDQYHMGTNLTPEQQDQNAELKRELIRGTFDIQELCRQSLDQHWDAITEVERKHFVELMTRLLEKKAVLSKEQVSPGSIYKINYVSETYLDAQKTKAKVLSRLVIPKDRTDFNLTYFVLSSPYGWKIYDVVVDEASLMTNYKFQFDKIIEKGGIKDLFAKMESKLGTMK